MNQVLEMPAQDEFDALLDGVLVAEIHGAVPSGMVQRVEARLAQEITAAPVMFASATRIAAQRSSRSLWTAIGLHAAVIALIAFVVARRVSVASSAMRAQAKVVYLEELKPSVPMKPAADAAQGGGGNHDLSPTTQGHLPQFTREQLLAPKAPPTIAPKLPVEPTLVAESTPKIADSKLPDLGVPNSSLHGFSLGSGGGNGIGPGSGDGAGTGAKSGAGGGIYHPGGAVRAPEVLREVMPEFSEEARKAKFSGNVEVYLVVDEKGMPTHVRVVRDVGMGLGQKAVEAVEQYRFKPALLNGRPVKADMYVLVDFQIF